MKLLLLLTMSLVSLMPSTSEYAEDFTKGYKYVLDNQDQFEDMTEDQFLTAIKKQFNINTSIRIQTLDEVLAAGNHTWSPELTTLLTSYVQSTKKATTYEEFVKSLMTFEQGASRLSSPERIKVLQYIKLIREIMDLLYTDLQFYVQCCDFETEMANWFQRWGRCAAAIAGGMGSGALAGAVVGTAPLPGLGTITGAVIGAVSGGLTGAAAGC